MNKHAPHSLFSWIAAFMAWCAIFAFFKADFFRLAKMTYSLLGPLTPVFVFLLAYTVVQAVIIVTYAFAPLDEHNYETLQEYLDHNKELSDLLPTLGLLGTVLGMIMSVQDLKPETFFQCLSTTLLGGGASFVIKLLIIFVDRITFLRMWRQYEPTSESNNNA